jgi:mono/diheme cytochrome c family protein
MSTRKLLTAAALYALASSAAFAEGPNLGMPVTNADIEGWDISIPPNGSGLPKGSGTAALGAAIFADKCAMCHGENGKVPTVPAAGALVSDIAITDISAALKTIPNFWPYATTLFDYTRRSMPWQMPGSLTNDEVWSLTAFLLARNKITGESDVMNAETLPKVKMPNRDGFIVRFPDMMSK